jgi:N-acetyl-anhydromuramyl-L-alanine amidase AmpD
MRNRKYNEKKRIKWDHILIWILAILLTIVAVWLLLRTIPEDDVDVDALLEESSELVLQSMVETEPETEEDTYVVPMPDIDEQLLTINDYSRPGEAVDAVEKVVIHYLANPKTTAQQNHDYFESLKDLQDVSMSANFVIGIEGEIIECVPPGEIAYASNSMNHLSVSIENCHLDETGIFTEETYNSCVQLTAYLVDQYGLERDDIIRHYDVTGKECPLYYVQNEDKWEKFKDDVMAYIEECRAEAE